MIFVTVGTQLPFPRLVKGVDQWAANHPDQQVFIQLGEPIYIPQHCQYTTFTKPHEWDRYFQQAELIVSHAGMGTILKSLDISKPLVIMPRLAALNEHRNDHQVATAKKFAGISSFRIVCNEIELEMALNNPQTAIDTEESSSNTNLNLLIGSLRCFVSE